MEGFPSAPEYKKRGPQEKAVPASGRSTKIFSLKTKAHRFSAFFVMALVFPLYLRYNYTLSFYFDHNFWNGRKSNHEKNHRKGAL